MESREQPGGPSLPLPVQAGDSSHRGRFGPLLLEDEMELQSLIDQARETLGEKTFSDFSKFVTLNGGVSSLKTEQDFISAVMRFTHSMRSERGNHDFGTLRRRSEAANEAIREWGDLVSVMLESRWWVFADLEDINDAWMLTTAEACVSESRFGIDCHGIGVVYVMELPGGVKVGKTSDLQKRFKFHTSAARNFGIEIGRVAFSDFHGNFSKNEKIAHSRLSEFQVSDSEFFAVDFDYAIATIGELDLLAPKGYPE